MYCFCKLRWQASTWKGGGKGGGKANAADALVQRAREQQSHQAEQQRQAAEQHRQAAEQQARVQSEWTQQLLQRLEVQQAGQAQNIAQRTAHQQEQLAQAAHLQEQAMDRMTASMDAIGHILGQIGLPRQPPPPRPDGAPAQRTAAATSPAQPSPQPAVAATTEATKPEPAATQVADNPAASHRT